jgi:hypothetical protein
LLAHPRPLHVRMYAGPWSWTFVASFSRVLLALVDRDLRGIVGDNACSLGLIIAGKVERAGMILQTNPLSAEGKPDALYRDLKHGRTSLRVSPRVPNLQGCCKTRQTDPAPQSHSFILTHRPSPARAAPPLPQAGEVKNLHVSRLREKVDRERSERDG